MESKACAMLRCIAEILVRNEVVIGLAGGAAGGCWAPSRPLFISVCEGKRRPAPRDQLSHRFRDHTPGCGSDLSIRIDERGHSLCRNRTCKRQGRRQAEITTDFV